MRVQQFRKGLRHTYTPGKLRKHTGRKYNQRFMLTSREMKRVVYFRPELYKWYRIVPGQVCGQCRFGYVFSRKMVLHRDKILLLGVDPLHYFEYEQQVSVLGDGGGAANHKMSRRLVTPFVIVFHFSFLGAVLVLRYVLRRCVGVLIFVVDLIFVFWFWLFFFFGFCFSATLPAHDRTPLLSFEAGFFSSPVFCKPEFLAGFYPVC